MVRDLKLITSRRAYEFKRDSLRLSLLSLPQVQTQISQVFGFQTVGLGTPQPTFGSVLAAVPPGVVFNFGAWQDSEPTPVPIRFVHFEQTRIVIDVAGPSSVIDSIFQAIRAVVDDVKASDGSAAIGEVERTLDYSEFSGRFSFDLGQLFVPQARELFWKAAGPDEQNGWLRVAVPSIFVQRVRPDQDYHGVGVAADSHVLAMSTRAGTRPDDGVSFSGAPLDSETHREYLNQLEEALLSEGS
jgi:hypothetical protein